ncbi:Hypothetical protein CINCED_3A024806 [Cinara cedri]|uniref:Protein sleepless n=1 Tax=Cinara cedri TaxID=506608 RepID=A0A5E4NQK3_9HEMI|nr:Hypothetical protein CINCED_3A024806 [Cinara cedri]
MNNITNFYLLLALTCISTIRSVVSISCYQCNSTDIENQFLCSEFMDTQDFGLSARPCTDVYNAAYCIKLVGRYEGGLGTKRYCSSHDLGNYCNYVRQPGDTKNYRTCVYTCNSDGCNGSTLVKSFGYLIGISFLLLFKWLLL